MSVLFHGLFECLIDVRQDIIDMLNTDA